MMNVDLDEEVRVERLSERDLPGISALVTRMETGEGATRLRDKSAAYYRWMYLENPAGPAAVHCAHNGGDVMGSFALAPRIFQVDGAVRVLGKTMDMFTDPRFQGRGVISRCAEGVFADGREAGVEHWYVTPSVNSYPIFVGKWGCDEDLSLMYRFRILRYGRVLATAGRLGAAAGAVGRAIDTALRLMPKRAMSLPPGYSLTRMQSFGEQTDDLWREVSGGYRVAQVRNAAYLNWRYVNNPDTYTILALRRAGRLRGIVVLTSTLRRGLEVGEIVDHVCAVHDDETFQILIGAALAHSREQGHAMVQAWSIRGTRSDARLRRAGLPLRRRGVKFLVSPGIPESAVHDPEAWLLTQGDGNDV